MDCVSPVALMQIIHESDVLQFSERSLSPMEMSTPNSSGRCSPAPQSPQGLVPFSDPLVLIPMSPLSSSGYPEDKPTMTPEVEDLSSTAVRTPTPPPLPDVQRASPPVIPASPTQAVKLVSPVHMRESTPFPEPAGMIRSS